MNFKLEGKDPGFYAILLAATFLMASSFIAGKILLQHGIPPFSLVGWRFLLAAFAALPLVYFETGSLACLLPAGFKGRDWAIVALIGLLQTALVMGLMFWAMQSISASIAAILSFTNPLWVALLGRFFLNERLSLLQFVALLCGIIGVAMALGIQAAFSSTALTGELTALGAAFCWAVSTLVNKRAALKINSWALSFWQMLTGSLALIIIANMIGQKWPQQLALTDWGWFLWLAIPGSTASFGLWFIALKRGGATYASGFLFLAPLFTVILSALILGTGMTLTQGFGGVLIGLSLWLLNRPRIV